MKQKLFMTRFLNLIACLLVFSAALIPRAFSGENSGIEAEPYFSEGDAHLFGGAMEDARKIYEFILSEDPDSYGALWRLSRFYISSGMAAEKTKDKKEEWKKAAEYARRAIEVKPAEAEGHLYLAIATGKIALYSSAGDKVKASWEIKEEAEKAMQLDPAQDKAYLTLGAWHRNVATATSMERQLAKMFFGELPEASLEESLRLLQKSIGLGGNSVRNYYELALTYEAMGDYESARKEYAKALSARSVYPEDGELKERVKNTLRKSKYN